MATAVSSFQESAAAVPAKGAKGFESALHMALNGVALVYAFLAGVRTVTDYDLFWQMATGRWIAQHHAIPPLDVFSYTAAGQPWIYPVGSGLIFYGTYLLGGYALLSWLGALACVVTVVLLLRRGSGISAAIAIFAVPRIAARTTPRADMFTVLLFATFLSLLWEQYETGRARLWLLPPLMAAWVNLHLGFISGLALLACYVGMESLRLLSADRHDAILRLRRALPWLGLSCVATLCNPWGWELYKALDRQHQVMSAHSQWIAEWASQAVTWQGIFGSYSTFSVLLLVALLAVVVGLVQREIGPAVLLMASVYAGLRHVRFQVLFACVVVVVGGSILHKLLLSSKHVVRDARTRGILAGAATALLAVYVAYFCLELVSNRYYFGRTNIANFGVGLSWWFPEAAADFIEQNGIPGQIWNSYNEGGYLTWRLGPKYADYIDGRAIPFGPLFARSDELNVSDPDSEEWAKEADHYRINALLIPLGRFEGLSLFPKLRKFCSSDAWRPIYLDEVSAVFVRNTPQNRTFLERFAVNCKTASIPGKLEEPPVKAFNRLANASGVLYALGRPHDAAATSTRALNLFGNSAFLHFIRAKCYAESNMFRQAEGDYLIAASLEPNDAIFSELAQLYADEGRVELALSTLEKAASYSKQPYISYLTLGEAYVQAQRPRQALPWFDAAQREAPKNLVDSNENRSFLFRLAQGRADAWAMLGQPQQALQHQEQAARLRPKDAAVWRALSELYSKTGRVEDATRAKERSDIEAQVSVQP